MEQPPSINALILAAGFGTRLNHLSHQQPKGLIKANNGTLISQVINGCLQPSQVKNLAVITNARDHHHYQANLNNHYPNQITLINNGVSDPEKRLGALGDITYSVNQLKWFNHPIMVLASDTYHQFSLEDLINIYNQHQAFTTVVNYYQDKSKITNRLGCAQMEGDRVVGFTEKPAQPKSHYAAVPFYIYPTNPVSIINQYQNDGGNLDTPGSIIPWLLDHHQPVFALKVKTPTLDVGTPEDIQTLRADYWKLYLNPKR